MKKLLFILLFLILPILSYSATKEELEWKIRYLNEKIEKTVYENQIAKIELQQTQKEYQDLLEKEKKEKEEKDEPKP